MKNVTEEWVTEFHPIVEVLSNDDHKLVKVLLELLVFYTKLDHIHESEFDWIFPYELFKNAIKYFKYDSYLITDLLSNNVDFIEYMLKICKYFIFKPIEVDIEFSLCLNTLRKLCQTINKLYKNENFLCNPKPLLDSIERVVDLYSSYSLI
ncbi:hypothetical protein HZS_2306 [Henneguya salminicola]|nr:hypothetical protein HZS_2306 [Henneguya salminicola]